MVGVACCCVVPFFVLFPVLFVVFPALYCPASLCVVCCGWGSVVVELCPALPPPCVCCHSIVGLVRCLCDRTLLLWNGGGGLCWVEWRWVVLSARHNVSGV